jgi:hypothetical protein
LRAVSIASAVSGLFSVVGNPKIAATLTAFFYAPSQAYATSNGVVVLRTDVLDLALRKA